YSGETTVGLRLEHRSDFLHLWWSDRRVEAAKVLQHALLLLRPLELKLRTVEREWIDPGDERMGRRLGEDALVVELDGHPRVHRRHVGLDRTYRLRNGLVRRRLGAPGKAQSS